MTRRLTGSLAAGALSCGMLVSAAWAADLPEASDDAQGADVETQNIFGFTQGSDTNEAGEQEVSSSAVGAFGRQSAGPGPSHYEAWFIEAEYEYGVTDDLTLSGGLSFSVHDIENIAEIEDIDTGGFNGLGGEVRYRFLNREDNPVGLTLVVEPEWSRYDDDTGELANAFEIGTKLLVDRELVADILYAAVNVGFAAEWQDDQGGTEQGSALEVSGALSAQIVEGFFLGGELRFLADYEGAGLDSFDGNGLYVGPSAYVQLTDAPI